MTNFSFHTLRLLWTLLFFFLSCCDSSTTTAEKSSFSAKSKTVLKILIVGDSLTEGYGVYEYEAYPALLQDRLNLELSQSTGIKYRVINGGITGSTTSGGLGRIEWLLRAKPDYLILALGGNDGLRGIPVQESKKNLSTIIEQAKSSNIPTMLAGMKMPPNYGIDYTKDFENMYSEIAETHEIELLPFLLEGVGGNPKMNLPDGIHPNASGHKVICDLVYTYLSAPLIAISSKYDQNP